MHGWQGGEETKRGGSRCQHMWTEPTRANCSSVLTDVNSPSPRDSFYKDGRKISVGDCALFKPPQDSPPFIGIIRCLTTGKENKLKLGVNWLYRPAEVKLGKGILLEAAPNEIFYSCHKDEILAASLLHPCKVAFLPKGVELPSGICSFVCRRVYDITNKCLWWLTDQDYINELQEEVDQLLYKTRLEMHATIQPGGRSPKPMNGPTSTSQLKPSSDSVQNSVSSFPSQGKGKKRERSDQGIEPIKRERFTKMDDGDSGLCRTESMWKSEIAKFTEKGGLIDFEGVQKLVQLMLPDRNDKRVDLIGRSILASVIAATDKFDCLNRFVQLRGLPVFDEWLQEVHKGKIGDASSPKDSDKSVEEFLIVLLRALDKLPINLHALQMCNIGKSVNHLRSHKNLEIQKKARSLVDTWKKRVEAEMDAKSGSNQSVPWPARSRLPEVSHGGNRHSGASTEVAIKSSVVQLPASKTAPIKISQGEITIKSTAASPGSMKSAASPLSMGNNFKEGHARNSSLNGNQDLPITAARDEKSSSSSQSHNNSQSCSSDHAKAGGKEDAKSSTAGSATENKVIGGSLRHRKSANGFQGASVVGSQREAGSSRGSSLHRNAASEKLSQSSLTCDKAVDVPMAEGSAHKLIVKIPNRGRSPVQSASGGSVEDPSVMNSRASSPALSEKPDQFDRNVKEKNDTYRANLTSEVNTESWQSNDFKEVLTGSDEGDGSPAAVTDEDHCRTGGDSRKLVEVSKASSSSSGNEHKSGKLHESSFSSINAFIENCVKYSEANATMSVGDDVGMNLLASVAAGEIPKSGTVSPADSPQRNLRVVEHSSSARDSRLKTSTDDDLARDRGQSDNVVDDEDEKAGIITETPVSKNTDGKPLGEVNGPSSTSCMEVEQTTESCLGGNVRLEEQLIAAVPTSANTLEKTSNGVTEPWEEKLGDSSARDGVSDTKEKLTGYTLTENKAKISGVVVETKAIEGLPSYPSLGVDGENKKNTNEDLIVSVEPEQKPPAMIATDLAKVTSGEVLQSSGSSKDVVCENLDEVKPGRAEKADDKSHSSEKIQADHEFTTRLALTGQRDECVEDSQEGNKVNELCTDGLAPAKASSVLLHEQEQRVRVRGSKISGSEADEAEECTSAAVDNTTLSATAGSDVEAKVEFDLNEGFNADDGKYVEPDNLKAPPCSASVPLISPFPLPVSSVSNSLPASITVAAAAKRPFVPPEDLLKNRGELGWKGSAATSAFRPAEPRKILEMPVGTANISIPDTTTAKPNRAPLDIDLNVPDERIFEDLASRSSMPLMGSGSDLANHSDTRRGEVTGSASVRSSGGLDLDLNRVDEPSDIGNHLTSNGFRLDVQLQSAKSSGGLLTGELSMCRDFDLNDGPLVDEVNAEPSPVGQHTRNSASLPSVSGFRVNNMEMGSFPSWFPQGSAYPPVTVQSMLPDGGEQSFPIVAPGGPQRILATPTGSAPFAPDVYRGPVLTSSPAVPFPTSPFQYPVFPFGTNFPLPSASFPSGPTTYVDSAAGGRICFPAMHSPVLASTGPSHYARPYVVSLTDSNSNGGIESGRKWVRQGLDLNAGPLGTDTEGREEISSLASRQLSVASSQAALAEDQSRMYHAAGSGVLKRKEPEGGWEGYKQSSWH